MPRPLRALAAFACLLLVAGLGAVAAAAPASAASTILCKGYDGCARLSMSDAGYKAANRTMWWRMYAGHNCTNYVAYRLVRSGLPNVRPWSGGGNANLWGHSNAELTDAVPAVGAVAWWDKNVRPAGSSGHVAYVEQVVSPDEIIVSQDSWGGDFSWARITRAGGSWPSGFVHFNDVPLTNLAKPAVLGTPKVGAVLTASTGAWSQPDVSYRYQWRADGVDIADAQSPTLQLAREQQGRKISVRMVATKVGYPKAAATSPRTPAVEPGEFTNGTAPTVTGDAKVDSVLTASPGTWTPAPTSLTYQWAADGSPIPGATSTTLVPDAALVGRSLTVTVTAAKDGYLAVPATSTATAAVAPGTFTVSGSPTVAGSPRLGQTLSVTPHRYAPRDAELSVQWLRAGLPVPGAVGTTYQITGADLGARIGAELTLTRPGYTTLVTRTNRTALVRSVPKITLVKTPGRGRFRLQVSLRADGVSTVAGSVVVRARGLRQELVLRRGTAAVTLRDLPRGRLAFTVRYRAGTTLTGTTVSRSVRIR